jgi:AGZA family xanthine/uracil permease-like MFS transporter
MIGAASDARPGLGGPGAMPTGGFMLDRYFQISAQGSTAGREVLAGTTTFLTMAYITLVNPAILSDAGMDFGAVFVATCVGAAFGSLVMGLVANYPIALAPGMGINAFFTYTVVLGMGHTWQVALGAVFVAGVVFVILSVLPVREWIINSIPLPLKLAISAGIGLFLGLIALQNAAIVVDHPATLVMLGDLKTAPPLLAICGFFVMVALDVRKIPGAIIIGILVTTAAGLLLGVSEWKGFASLPPDPTPTLLQMDIAGALDASLLAVIFAFLFVDLFDTAGALMGVCHRAGLLDERGRLPRLGRALFADSTATVVGAALGTSPVTSYIESAAGIKAGGRTGFTAVVVAILFLFSLFLSPLAQTVPDYATAPALLYVACLMTMGLTEVHWDDPTEYAPAVVTAIAIPFTFSIADGIGLGFISYTVIKLLSGRVSGINPAVIVIALAFVVRFLVL